MPATLVFKSSGPGSLQQVQVGAADIVSTLAAAHSAWGWLGGLAGVQRFINTLRNVMQQDPFASLRINKILIPSAECHILTSRGMFYFQDEDSQSAFGGDPLMQTIGLTICALEHECGGEMAVGLFVKHIASQFVDGRTDAGKFPALSQALYQALIDHLPAIINEGASRNLRGIFLSAAAELPQATERWHFPSSPEDGSSQHPEHFELSLLIGMLQWLSITGDDHPYYTRSSLTARSAAYLKAIGYPIGPITVWDGQGDPPVPKPRGIVLVVGGFFETDFEGTQWYNVPETGDNKILKLYFREETIGSMFVNALGAKIDLMPESVQDMFASVQLCIAETLCFNWEIPSTESQKSNASAHITDRDGVTLLCTCRMKEPRVKPTSLASSLAAIYFGTTADLVALCYERIATVSCITNVRAEKLSELDLVQNIDLAWFRVVTASIIYCIAEALARDDFKAVSHVVKMSLCSGDWLESMAQRLNHTLRTGIPFYDAAIIVGIMHAAASTDLLEIQTAERSAVLGIRNGCYAVVPALFYSMCPTSDSVGIVCFDKFIANVPTFPDCTIRGQDATGPSWSPPDKGRPVTEWQTLGEPVAARADMPLYMSIERAHNSSKPSTVFCTRIAGAVADTLSVKKVMWNVLKSLRASASCTGHEVRQRAITLKASNWLIIHGHGWDRYEGELMKKHHMFLPALGDSAWALCIAGSILHTQVAISYGCFECAASTIELPRKPSIICGYGEICGYQQTLLAPPGRKQNKF